ncbi:family 43 glycosylhydrolase [Arthrobacter sp. MDT2-16]
MSRVICNPIDLPYRYQDFGRGPLRAVFREAADPSIVLFRDVFYLFGSMSGGFWHSPDLVSWTYAHAPQLPAGDYAPDVREIDGSLYVTASRRKSPSPIFRSTNPLTDPFREVAQGAFPYWDPNLFQDDDGQTFLYWGCSNKEPLRGVQVDRNTFQSVGEPMDLLNGNPGQHGWERPGESNHVRPAATLKDKVSSRLFGTHSQAPFIEGPWLTKHDGTYYLQYAGPGTEYNVYADGYYTGKSPLGPFTYSPHSPFSSKPGGFITGAGHGSTFQDQHGNWWHAATMRVSVNHHFERRIGIFPAGFDADGVLFCNQVFGDYPLVVPDGKIDPWEEPAQRWMLQSYKAAAIASSSLAGHGAELAVNEDIRTWWVAGTSQEGETLTLDLEYPRTVHAVQVSLADHNVRQYKPKRPLRDPDESRDAFRTVLTTDHPTLYLLEGSEDGRTWQTLHDGRLDASDAPHRLVVLPTASVFQFMRITGLSTPWNAALAVSGVRVFGVDNRKRPDIVTPSASRTEPRSALIRWSPADGAEGYNVRYGRQPDKLYHSWQVWEAAELELRTLTAGEEYWVSVDSYNSGGVTPGQPICIPAGQTHHTEAKSGGHP